MGSAFAAASCQRLAAAKYGHSGAVSVEDASCWRDLAYNFLQEFVPFVRPHSLRHH